MSRREITPICVWSSQTFDEIEPRCSTVPAQSHPSSHVVLFMMNKTLKKLKRLNAYSYDVNDLNASDDPG